MPPQHDVPAADEPPPRDPVEIAWQLRRRAAEAEARVARPAANSTDASAALRGYIWQRQAAWAESAAMVEGALRARTAGRYWHVVRRLVHPAEATRAGAAGPVFRTAAALRAATPDRFGPPRCSGWNP